MQWGDTQKGYNKTFTEVSTGLVSFMSSQNYSFMKIDQALSCTFFTQDSLSQVFKAAVAGGINFFDTAEVAFSL